MGGSTLHGQVATCQCSLHFVIKIGSSEECFINVQSCIPPCITHINLCTCLLAVAWGYATCGTVQGLYAQCAGLQLLCIASLQWALSQPLCTTFFLAQKHRLSRGPNHAGWHALPACITCTQNVLSVLCISNRWQ